MISTLQTHCTKASVHSFTSHTQASRALWACSTLSCLQSQILLPFPCGNILIYDDCLHVSNRFFCYSSLVWKPLLSLSVKWTNLTICSYLFTFWKFLHLTYLLGPLNYEAFFFPNQHHKDLIHIPISFKICYSKYFLKYLIWLEYSLRHSDLNLFSTRIVHEYAKFKYWLGQENMWL